VGQYVPDTYIWVHTPSANAVSMQEDIHRQYWP